jgi:hypothetical protein
MSPLNKPNETRSKKKTVAVSGAEPSKLTTKAFWPLIDKWQIADEKALRLLGHEGGLTSTGKRPRFTLTVDEARRVPYLRQIDLVLETVFGGTDWLSKPIRQTPFKGLSPIDFMIKNQMPAFAEVLRYLNRLALSKAVR